ncbi:PaaI family thioesterase [Pseudoroseomonas cervicalis]|nr:PaaI family thioesterase [Pseudoroseomonas cervicalis]
MAADTPPSGAGAAGWRLAPGNEFLDLVGPLWARKEGDGWAYGLQTKPHHANGRAIVHGGLLVTLADNALGMTVWEATGRQPAVTMQLNTHFLATAQPGDFIEARAEILRRTRSVVFVRGVLSVGDRPILAADGIWKLLNSGG